MVAVLERPREGWARVVGVTGKVSDWLRVEAMDISEKSVFLQGDMKGLAAVEFSWVSLSHIEYITDSEMVKIKGSHKGSTP